MQQPEFMKLMIDFNKTSFENTFNGIKGMQEQTEKMILGMVEKQSSLPEPVKKSVLEWVGTMKKSREEFKSTMDSNYKKLREFFE